jgi:hypothetical protein
VIQQNARRPVIVSAVSGFGLCGNYEPSWYPSNYNPTNITRVNMPHPIAGREAPDGADVWVFHQVSAATIEAWRLRILPGASAGAGISATMEKSFTAADFDISATSELHLVKAAFDRSDGALILHMRNSASTPDSRVIKWTPSGGKVWQTPIISTSTGMSLGRAPDPYFCTGRGFYVPAGAGDNLGWIVSPATGDLEVVEGYSTFWDHDFFDDRSAVLINRAFSRFLGRRQSDNPNVHDIVEDLVLRAGFEASDIDLFTNNFGDLPTVRGYVVSRVMTARAALSPLLLSAGLDLSEYDDVFYLTDRRDNYLQEIDFDRVLRVNQQTVRAERVQEVEIPREMTLRYPDVLRNYEPGAQTAFRPLEPSPVTKAQGSASLDLAVPMTPSEARRVCQNLLYQMWRQRTRWVLTFSAERLSLVKGNILFFYTEENIPVAARIVSVDIDTNWQVRVEAVEEAFSLDDLDAGNVPEAFAGTYFAGPTIQPVIVQPFLPDLPLVLESDESPEGLVEYVAVSGFADRFSAVRLASREFPLEWVIEPDPLSAPSDWGVALETLPPPSSPWSWDETNSVVVRMLYGAPENAAPGDVLNGDNAGVLFRPGAPLEIIQWTTAEPLGDDEYRLSGLLRGRRGTEDGCGARAAGDRFFILGATTRLERDLVLLGRTLEYRFQGRDGDFDTLPTLSREVAGRAERPYAPVFIEGDRDGSDNLTITWVRRTRRGGELRGGTGTVPLSEDAEAYEVEILDGGGDVVRTITDLASPTASYSAADQTTDGLTPGDPVAVRVYQMSGRVGRGIPGSATV